MCIFVVFSNFWAFYCPGLAQCLPFSSNYLHKFKFNLQSYCSCCLVQITSIFTIVLIPKIIKLKTFIVPLTIYNCIFLVENDTEKHSIYLASHKQKTALRLFTSCLLSILLAICIVLKFSTHIKYFKIFFVVCTHLHTTDNRSAIQLRYMLFPSVDCSCFPSFIIKINCKIITVEWRKKALSVVDRLDSRECITWCCFFPAFSVYVSNGVIELFFYGSFAAYTIRVI